MNKRLWTIQEVAEHLRCSARHVRNLKIPVVRIDRRRLYDPRDVEQHIQGAKCLSSSGPGRHIGKLKSSSKEPGLLEALARHPGETPSNSNARSAISFGGRSPNRNGPRKPRLIKPADVTGANTGDA